MMAEDFSQFKMAEDFSQFDEVSEPKKKEMAPSYLRAAQGYNVGLAKMAGAPVDLMNFALSFVGLDSEEPVGGSKNIQKGMSKLGWTPEPGQEGETLGKVGRIAEEVGASTIPVAATATAVRLGAKGGPILKSVFDFFRERPIMSVAAEATSSVGAGVGAVIANEIAPDSMYAEMTGQLLGGIVSSPTLIAEFSPNVISTLRRSARVLATREGAKDTAAQIVQKSARNKEEAIRQLESATETSQGSVITSGKQSSDAGLMALEKSAMKKSEELKDGVAEALTSTNKAVTEELESVKGSGNIDALRATVEDKVAYLKNLMSIRVTQALKSASEKLSKLSPNTPRESANEIVRREIEDAYDAARLQERELWEAVPKESKATIDNTKSAYDRILKSRDPVVDDPEDLPKWLNSLLTGDKALKGEQKLGRIHKIRSRILDEIRSERGKDVPNRNKMRILGQLADAALEDMATGASDEIALARAFSRDFNERFTQGTVGDYLGFNKTGEASIPSELTLERAGRPGPAGAVAVDDINRATGVQISQTDTGFENVQQSTSDFIADKFLRKFPNGEVNVDSGKRFLLENREVLARYPSLRAEIEDAITSKEKADLFIQKQKGLEKRLTNRNKTAAAVFLDAPVGKEVRRVLSTRNPMANMKSLVARASKDKTGEAMKGLKAGVIDEIFKSGRKSGSDLDMRPILDGESMQTFLKDNSKAILESGVLSPDEIKRLNRAINTAVKSQRRIKTGYPGQEIIDESPDAFTDMILSIIGANIGGASSLGQATGAPLVLAGRTASAARNIGRKWLSKIPAGKVTEIINEAILDNDLMLELLKRPKTIEQAVAHHRALRAFLFNIVPESFSEPITIEIQSAPMGVSEQ